MKSLFLSAVLVVMAEMTLLSSISEPVGAGESVLINMSLQLAFPHPTSKLKGITVN